MPCYFLSLFKIPASVAAKIERLQRDFLWSGVGEGKRDHLVSWDVVCNQKAKGGLGFGKISIRNFALLGKWLWRYPRRSDGHIVVLGRLLHKSPKSFPNLLVFPTKSSRILKSLSKSSPSSGGEGGDVKAFQHQLREDPGWRADLEGLQLKSLDLSEAEALEVPFTEEEIFSALMDMNGDKALGPDGFTMAFWQVCWDFIKEEVVELFKEFYDQKSFAKSLNSTFLVIIPKKGGAEDLGEFQPISLLRGLYKLMAKVLANRLKMVLDKVVSADQNAFVRGRQILDASLIANEVVDYWQKRKEKGLVCKLDIEKAYDSINWSFLMKVPEGFFSSSKGLRQGDPISPYLFILGMEVLSALIRRAVQGNFISGCRLRGRGDAEIMAASELRINLAKSELIPVGEIDNIEEMAVELGCRIGSFPVKYLGPGTRPCPRGRGGGKNEEKTCPLERQYLSKAGESPLLRVPWPASPSIKCPSLECLSQWLKGLRNYKRFSLGRGKHGRMGLLNKALLAKWIWRFVVEKDVLWKKVIGVKHGLEGCGWKSKEVRGPFGVGVWKEILKEMSWCWNNMKYKIFALAVCNNELVNDVWDPRLGQGGWNLRLARDSNDWELVLIEDLLFLLRDIRVTPEEDSVLWKGGDSAMVRALWEIAFALFGVQWVFPKKVKEALFCWQGPFVGKKRKKIWKSIPLWIFWTVWKERNRLAFRGGSLAIQTLKNSFVCSLWNWAKLYRGEESSSLLGFLEWVAVP
ncbi:Transposon TX1 uncharacterized 149 kDa protein [Vitis vinifera]|uniref:Transposon TX1 uncharacterized 149 kDa protein n=1 Tax=Vitis vinifera TaxID=29760 RepID=A0A438GIK4_VITVI|nr:Transposon TX1 uncharacterized 149 kDa protein [Vitis vinifera]